jgi:hypothetical protein
MLALITKIFSTCQNRNSTEVFVSSVQCCLIIGRDILNFDYYTTDLRCLMILQGRPERLPEAVAAAGASVSVGVV